MRLTFLVGAMIAVLFAGCASRPKFENKEMAGDATIRCEVTSFGGVMTGDVRVTILEIDGARTGLGTKGDTFHLRPGKHELALTVTKILTGQDAQQYVEIDAAAGHKYRLAASKKDGDFLVEIADETDPKAVVVVTVVKMKASFPDIPLLIPVPVK